MIDEAQYSALVAAVVLSAVVPTLIANAFFLPRHLLPKEPEKPAGATAIHSEKEATARRAS